MPNLKLTSKPRASAPASASTKRRKQRTSQPVSSGRQLPYSDRVVSFYTGECGAFRLSDNATAPTALFPMVTDLTPFTNVNGDLALAFHPSLNWDSANCVVTTGNLASTWTTTAHPQLNTLTGSSIRMRMTGWRITIRYTGAEQNCSGAFWVAPSVGFLTTMISSSMTNYTPTMREYACRPGGEWTFYVPMLSVPDFEANSNTLSSQYWTGFVILGKGLPASTSVFNIRSERSMEYIPELSVASLVDAEPEPYDPVGLAEAGIFAGTAQDNGNDRGPGWAHKLGQATYNLVRATGRGVVEAARADVRQHMQNRHLHLMDL